MRANGLCEGGCHVEARRRLGNIKAQGLKRLAEIILPCRKRNLAEKPERIRKSFVPLGPLQPDPGSNGCGRSNLCRPAAGVFQDADNFPPRPGLRGYMKSVVAHAGLLVGPHVA